VFGQKTLEHSFYILLLFWNTWQTVVHRDTLLFSLQIKEDFHQNWASVSVQFG